MKDELSGKIMKEFVGLRVEKHSYLNDNSDEDEKPRSTKKCVIKRCLEAPQTENKINDSEKNKVAVDSLKEDHKDFIKNNKLILRTQQRFRSEKHNVFIEKINKIASSSNDNKRIQ